MQSPPAHPQNTTGAQQPSHILHSLPEHERQRFDDLYDVLKVPFFGEGVEASTNPSYMSASTSSPTSDTTLPSNEDVAPSESSQPLASQYAEIDDAFIASRDGGLIRLGTRRGLVKQLLTNTVGMKTELKYHHFKTALLTSYRAFTTVDELLQLLLEEFRSVWSLANTQERARLHSTVVALLKLWLDENHIKPCNLVFLEKMYAFAINFEQISQESNVFQTKARELIQLIDTNITKLSLPILDLEPSTSLASSTTAQQTPDVLPHLLAKALSSLASRYYRNIKETDYFDWLEDPNISNAVSHFIAEDKKLCFWVQLTILNLPHYSQRRENVKFFLDVVQHCIELRNFASACSLLNGLVRTAITDLKRTYGGLSRNKLNKLTKRGKLIDSTNDYKYYRTVLRKKRSKCVPWLQIHLRDLEMRHGGDPIFVDEHGRKGLINFERCHRIHISVRELLSYEPLMDVPADDSDIAAVTNWVGRQLNDLVIDTESLEWLRKRSITLKLEEQEDNSEEEQEDNLEVALVAAGFKSRTNAPSARSGPRTFLSTSGTTGSLRFTTTQTTDVPTENIEGASRSIVPDDPFDRNSTRCLDGRIKNVSKYAEAQGGFSDIYVGELDGKKVAIKAIRLFEDNKRVEDERLLKRLRREYMSWTWVSHAIVLECLGFAYDVGPEPYTLPRLISPWMSAGTLDHYMKTRSGLERLKALVDIAEGLSVLHDYIPSIIHGDIRGGNILMSDTGRPCLSDFGLAKVLKQGGMTATKGLMGTIRWMSPELLKDEVVPSTESDVWAYAMTILEIMSGQYPYADVVTLAPIVTKISRGELPMRPSMNLKTTLSDEIWAVCQKCWNFVPRQRPSMRAIYSELNSLLSNSPDL